MGSKNAIKAYSLIFALILSGFLPLSTQSFTIVPQHFDKEFRVEKIKMYVTYPEVRDLDDKVIYNLNYRIYELFLNSYNTFSEQVSRQVGGQPGGYSEFWLNYETCHKENGVISLLFTTQKKYYGENVTETIYKSINYDIEKGSFLNETDVFVSESELVLRSGSACKAMSNYSNREGYCITSDGLLFLWENAQCLIDWKTAKTQINPGFWQRIKY